MIQLIPRQQRLLDFFTLKSDKLAISDMLDLLKRKGYQIPRITLIRDLNVLRDLGLIQRSGRGRGVSYHLAPHYHLLRPIDIQAYFAKEEDDRATQTGFNYELFQQLGAILDHEESARLLRLNALYRENRGKLSPAILRSEYERLTIELSWKSSHIEGNTYSLLETETLIHNHQPAPGHSPKEADMILNHKRALDYIAHEPHSFKELTPHKIREVHELLTANLDIKRGFRSSPVGITGTRYRPLDNRYQIQEAVEVMCDVVNHEPDFFAKAILTSLLIAYIQPFEDGNKRSSRMLGNALLLAHDACPLSYRSVDETEYKKAVILFYEQNNLTYFKQLFIEQFEFSVNNYFRGK